MSAAEYRLEPCRSALNPVTGMPFNWSLNPYMGCAHRCTFCYVRAFEKRADRPSDDRYGRSIRVKTNVVEILKAELARASWTKESVAIGAATDPYQPAEGRFGITRHVLEAMTRVPGLRVGITTKSTGILRDREILGRLARTAELWVNVSLISLDADLLRSVEPRAPRPDLRLGAVRTLAGDGIRTRVFLMPVLPLLTDGEAGLRELLAAALHAGAREVISQALFLRTEMTWRFFLDFVAAEFPWALSRYRALYPRPGNAPTAYREEIDRRVGRLAAEVGFPARTREERVRAEAPARPRQLAIEW
jgi:DNA repair photolyase